MLYYSEPLERHFDSGFGAIGSVFFDAAEALAANRDFDALFNRRLPICCLYRHAIELYLKAGIVIIRRKHECSPDRDPEALPDRLGRDENFTRVDGIHSIETLYLLMRSLFERYDPGLKRIDGSPYEWDGATSDAIKAIEQFDLRTDYGRRPRFQRIGDDAGRSRITQMRADEVLAGLPTETDGGDCVTLRAGDSEQVAAHEHENKAIEELERSLTRVARFLHELHDAMRAAMAERA